MAHTCGCINAQRTTSTSCTNCSTANSLSLLQPSPGSISSIAGAITTRQTGSFVGPAAAATFVSILKPQLIGQDPGLRRHKNNFNIFQHIASHQRHRKQKLLYGHTGSTSTQSPRTATNQPSKLYLQAETPVSVPKPEAALMQTTHTDNTCIIYLIFSPVSQYIPSSTTDPNVQRYPQRAATF
ncbi:hypothetical protein OPT61_g10758 [Boeremia exigua]|uniref:Uncharacterized protein n=1 Tax=Boeremia exigua TaxID=749465 RepID=A0ACC2HNY0_9PLEO|nr:hypothetical protein OPT61_g10758 [Boeremia exigua]